MDDLTHASWIGLDQVDHATWLPASYAPVYRRLAAELEADADHVRELGELVGIASLDSSSKTAAPWVVRMSGIHPASVSAHVQHLAVLPKRCLVVRASSSGITAVYWNADLFNGPGATDPSSAGVLESTSDESIAWLREELLQPYVQLQATRLQAGTTVPRLSLDDLLGLRIRVPSHQSRRARSQKVEQDLRRIRNEIVHGSQSRAMVLRPFYLTAPSYKERQEQLEQQLLEQDVIPPEDAFFVQPATRDPEAELFVVRTLTSGGQELPANPQTGLRPEQDSRASRDWLDWYWNDDASWKVFNSLGTGLGLPSYLIERTIARTVRPPASVARHARIPSFSSVEATIEVHREQLLDADAAERDLLSLWRSLNAADMDAEEDHDAEKWWPVLRWLRRVYRPAVAVRAYREGEVAGAYLLYGPDQWVDPEGERFLLERLGETLAAIVQQPADVADDVLRRESLRRLSELMHQLSGPIATIDTELDSIREYLDLHPNVGAALAPSEQKAKARAAMTGRPEAEQSVRNRLERLASAVQSIRHLRYQVRKFRNAQGDLKPTVFSAREFLERMRRQAMDHVPRLDVHIVCAEDLQMWGDLDVLWPAFGQVLDNACRELKERDVELPAFRLTGEGTEDGVRISVRDNGLPVDTELLRDPFEEGASTYAKLSKGSGLGLVIVKEAVRRHGGPPPTLQPNQDEVGVRVPGVTFTAVLPRKEKADA